MKLKDLHKVEFWVSTIIYLFLFIRLISNTVNQHHNENWYRFYDEHISYSSFTNYFVPELFSITAIYLNFLLLNFFIIPLVIKKEKTILPYLSVALLIGATTLTIGICRTYSFAYELVAYKSLQHAYNHIFFKSFYNSFLVVVSIIVYILIKSLITSLINNNDELNKTQNKIKADTALGLAFWLIGMLFLLISDAAYEICVVWSLVIFSSIGIVIYSIYFLIPKTLSEGKKFKNYLFKIILASLLICIPIAIISLLVFNHRGEAPFVVILFHLPTQLLISAPLAWYLYKRRMVNDAELTSLKTELGKSDATLSFLQSQINPHFLFNALNTLYGTALQENAERTGEGIQKLGDMMRFMLHENTLDKISLAREVEYLSNYIDLQKLRTSRSADINIETHIEQQFGVLQITPMLLIPFVENAFKHGISLQQPSYIKISLQTKDSTLYFDVSNSIYTKAENDPEKLKSGIGLENVKKRLSMLYIGKHELIIRESAKEFFVHLTLQLD
ncbi:sensor histidine kinase [Pedobacter sp. GSP4]|uniref:sensor histidine kinase n=1 Tax=Pedobacter sp. GSP4 TaxID=3453716 RepID=UPI003EE84EBC